MSINALASKLSASIDSSVTDKKRKRDPSPKEEKVAKAADIENLNTSFGKKVQKMEKDTSAKVIDSQVAVKKMASKKFEGWKILLDGTSCGSIKFLPKLDAVFKNHATVDMSIRKTERGRNIGRIALKKAIDSSQYFVFVAHLRKSNIPSKKALSAVGFQETEYPGSRQLCMIFKKKILEAQ